MKKIPLLKYLFIASLISVILQLSTTSINLIKNPKDSLLEKAEQLREIKPDIANQLEELAYEYETNKFFQIMPYVNLLFLLFSLVSVILMWQLKWQGWYLYLFSEFFPYVFSFLFWDDYQKYYAGWGQGKVVVMNFVFLGFDILFAGLYYYALKESFKLQEISDNSDNDGLSM